LNVELIVQIESNISALIVDRLQRRYHCNMKYYSLTAEALD
jgi:hypothetical protein